MRFLKFVYPVLFLVILALLFFLPQRIIKITSISCKTQFGDCDNYLLSKLGQVKGKTLFEVKEKTKEILASEILVEDSQLQFNLPSHLNVDVLLKKPKFALKSLEKGVVLLVNEDGQGISVVSESNLPAVEIRGLTPDVGEKVDGKTLFALNLLNDVFYLYQDKVGILEDEKLVIDMTLGPKVIFPLTGDKDVLTGSLRIIISRLMQGAEELRIDNASEIDLRFKNPVIR